ncbi:MAG: XrtA/PEP-CTERM system histidine kinase PrsK [Dongiaceae bacterium]
MPPIAIGSGLCAVAFAGLAVQAARGRAPRRTAAAVACLAVAAWAVLAGVAGLLPAPADGWRPGAGILLETLRSLALLALLATTLEVVPGALLGGRRMRLQLAGLGAVAFLPAALDLAGDWSALALAAHLALALAGLVAMENAWRNAGADRLWSTKFLLIGLGALFAYDFYLYADALMFRRLDARLAEARPLVTALAAPFVAVSLRRRPAGLPLTLSRRAAFHTVALVSGGLYLLAMGAAGMVVRNAGGAWGPVFQIGFMAAAAMLLLAILASGSVRAALRNLVARHFFTYRYDYREEWLRFIAAIAEEGDDPNPRSRVIRAVAGVVDSPGGAMWLRDESSGDYVPAGRWNFRELEAREPAEGDLAAFLARTGSVVDLDQAAKRAPRYAGLACPDWLSRTGGAWVVVPLLHGAALLGFVVLQRARAPRALGWEDDDLLRTIGRQAAAFLAERQASRELADARQVQLFQRRFAFVAHDLKTVISQLSLLLANAETHGEDRAFQADLIATVRDSVSSMQHLLAQLRAERRRAAPAETVDLVPLARRLVAGCLPGRSRPALDCPLDRLEVQGDPQRVGAVLQHLLGNALDAARGDVTLRLRLGPPDLGAVVEIEDDGPGMSADFIQDQLFRPFSSTKADGLGIGAYQCRELTRELNGQLTVRSTPGKGTCMRVTLPAADLRLATASPARAVS